MAVGANSTYAAIAGFPLNAAVIAGTFGAIGTLSSLAWASSGTGLRLILRRPAAVRAFNIVMALLLVASLYPVLADA
jgi:threonine/homoserine/homoserine lactone efflux protein